MCVVCEVCVCVSFVRCVYKRAYGRVEGRVAVLTTPGRDYLAIVPWPVPLSAVGAVAVAKAGRVQDLGPELTHQ